MGAVGFTSGDPRKLNRTGYAKGDVVAADAAGALGAVTVGTDGERLAADSTETRGVDWLPTGGGGGSVDSVNGQTGDVVLDAGDVGADPAGTAVTAVATHSADTTNVHGIVDTAVLATDAEVTSAVAAHDADTTAVHGIANTAALVVTTDPRLSDARTPTAHAASHADGGADEVTLAQSQVTDLVTDLAARQPLDSDLTAIAALTPSNDDVLQRKAGAWTNRTIAQLLTDLNVARQTQTWSRDGDATLVTGGLRWYNRTGKTLVIHGAWVAAGTAPTGANLVVDVNRSGTTIFTTQANRPTVTAGTNGGVLAVPDVTTLADGDYLTVDVDQVGSVVAGADVTVGVVMS